MGTKSNLQGKIFGKLTVVGETAHRMQGSIAWKCVCACGTETLVSTGQLRSGHTSSCGCKKMDSPPPSQRTHGQSWVNGRAAPEYEAWRSMKKRCLNPRAKNFPDYGGRGISICKDWIDSFDVFLADMGQRPSSSFSLDRVDNNGNYEAANCRWADKWQQASNRRGNHLVTVDGVAMTVAEAARSKGLDVALVRRRLNRGWELERALQ